MARRPSSSCWDWTMTGEEQALCEGDRRRPSAAHLLCEEEGTQEQL